MNKNKASIITVKELLSKGNLKIPDYQRPYKWTIKNVNQLIDDIKAHNDKSAYRLGTLVVCKFWQHKNNEKEKISNEDYDKKREEEKINYKDVLDIVDGQQRIITLTLIAIAIEEKCKPKLEKLYPRAEELDKYMHKLNFSFTNDISKANIQNNYKEIIRRIDEFDDETIDFFYNKCEFVQIVLDDISEAFQFFDSQNARGKDLEPHDLLKAYHLRAMNNLYTEEELKNTVEKWEEMDTEDLSKLFAHYLFRIRNWSKGYSARYFTKDDVDVFKGISPNIKEDYPFAKIFRIAHYYIEDYNRSCHRNIVDGNRLFEYPFQIDQTIINGKRFFEMIAYYEEMISHIRKIEKESEENSVLYTIKNYSGCNRTGDKYVRNLFYCGLIYYADRFGYKDIIKAIDKIFVWAYTLRLQQQAVQLVSIDNYALGNIQLFKKIREASKPNDIVNMSLKMLNKNDYKSTKTEEIVRLFTKMGYYEERA